MLVLTRRNGEQILIDKGRIIIKVIYQRKGVVALGIQAPPHVDVDRKEIFIRKQTEEHQEDIINETVR